MTVKAMTAEQLTKKIINKEPIFLLRIPLSDRGCRRLDGRKQDSDFGLDVGGEEEC
ncbi:hypothetical protein QEN29_24280 [Escherichia coli]|nr:hypothetical protein QEN29_24280 [Escherichia coli]